MNKISYLAGLVDGDGNIYLAWKPKSKRFRPALRILINSEPKLTKFLTELGFRNYNHKNALVFILEDKKALEMIERILPYLKVRDNRAKLILKCKYLLPKKGKRYKLEEVKKLADIKEELHKLATRKTPLIWTKEKIIKLFVGET